MRLSKRKLHFLFLSFLCWRNRNRKKKKNWKKAKKHPIKIVFFKVVIQKCEKSKKWILAKIAWHYLCQEGRKTRIFVHTICFGPKFFGPKQCKPGNTIKIVVSVKLPKTKNDTFFWKWCFLTWERKWVLLTVFLKSCVFFSENTIFIVFSAKHSSCNKRDYMLKNRNLWKIVFLWTWQWQKVFFVCFLSGFNVIVVCFCVSGQVARVFKMLVCFAKF